MKRPFPFLTKLTEKSMTGLVFAVIFMTGLGVFSLSASIIVSSAFLAVSALAAYSVARQRGEINHPDAAEKHRETIEMLSSRLSGLEVSMRTVDARVLAAETGLRDHIRAEMAPMLDAIGTIATIVEEERRKSSAAFRVAPIAPAIATPPPPPQPEPSAFNPLHQVRNEAVLRDALLAGKIAIATSDIVALPTGRPAYRLLNAELAGDALPVNETRLRAEGVPSHLLRLFDKVRFGHGFEIAARLALNADSPVLVCPLTIETLSHPSSAQEISDLLARRPGIAKHLCFMVTEDVLFLDIGTTGQALRDIARAGCGFAIKVESDIRIDPASLHGRGVVLAIVTAELILATRDGNAPSEIHPADLVQLFDRHGIDLAVTRPTSDRVLRGIRSLGINLVMRPNEERSRPQVVRMRPERPSPAPASRPGVAFDPVPESARQPAVPEPLRAHLRRVSA